MGQEIARGLANAGVSVALNDLLPDRIEDLSSRIRTRGSEALVAAADVTRKLALQTMLENVLDIWKRIDILIFIAKVQPPDAILDMDEWDWHRTIDMNLTAAFLCTQSVGRLMRSQGGGVIVNLLTSADASPAYMAAAAGLQAFSLSAARELTGHNIQVHALNAGESTVAEIISLCKLETAPITSNK